MKPPDTTSATDIAKSIGLMMHHAPDSPELSSFERFRIRSMLSTRFGNVLQLPLSFDQDREMVQALIPVAQSAEPSIAKRIRQARDYISVELCRE